MSGSGKISCPTTERKQIKQRWRSKVELNEYELYHELVNATLEHPDEGPPTKLMVNVHRNMPSAEKASPEGQAAPVRSGSHRRGVREGLEGRHEGRSPFLFG